MTGYLPRPTSLVLAALLALLPALSAADTLGRVRANNAFTLGYVSDFAPFSSQDGDKASGYSIDLCLKVIDRLKAQLNLPNLSVRYQPLKAADQISAVSSGKVDLLCTPTPETLAHRKVVSFSIPIYTAGLSAVVRNDAAEPLLHVVNGSIAHTDPSWRETIDKALSRKTIAAMNGSAAVDVIRDEMKALGIDAQLVTVESEEEGVKLVAERKAAAFFSERALLKNYTETSMYSRDLTVAGHLFEFAPASLVLERGDEDFRLLVDTALSEMYRSGEIKQAYIKHMGQVRGTSEFLFKVYALP